MKLLLSGLFFFILIYSDAQESNQRPSSGKDKRISFIQHDRLVNNSPYKDLQWRPLSPGTMSGRCVDVKGLPGNRSTLFAAFATGGLWRSTDTGKTWKPLMDHEMTLSMGNLAISASNPNIMFAGTGEANIFRASLPGIGIYKSEDGGNTWNLSGLENTGTIARILIHPTNPNIVYVAASGNEWSRNEDRGVYKSIDGGLNWKKVLYIDDRTGAIDIALDPSDPETVYASMWTRIRKRWSDPTPEEGDYIYKSSNGGTSWKKLTDGLPDTKMTGRIGIAVTPANPNVIYAFVDNHGKKREPKPGELDSYGRIKQFVINGAEVYKSSDKGEHWTLTSQHDDYMEHFSGTYGWVFSQIRVSPTDENKVFIMGLDLAQSNDGGKSWTSMSKDAKGKWLGIHGDHHALWIDPTNPQYILSGDDGGISVTYNGGISWKNFYHEIPTTQFYNVTYDLNKPFYVYGSVQDEGSVRMMSTEMYDPNVKGSGKFDRVEGGEGTRIVVDQEDNTTMYASAFYGRLQKSNLKKLGKKNNVESITPPAVSGEDPRGEWLAATSLSPWDGTTVYHGFQYVLKTSDQGKTWQKLSDDLTQNNKNKMGTTPYKISYQCITAIQESPKVRGLIYAGTDDGKVHFTTNEGNGRWTDISAGLLKDAAVSSIEPSRFEDGTVYLAMSDRREDNIAALAYKSSDYGKTWNSITSALPASPVNVLRQDPDNKDILYLGSDLGIYLSKDDGKTWINLNANLPKAISVQDLFIHPVTKQLVIATYGRGVFIVDRPK